MRLTYQDPLAMPEGGKRHEVNVVLRLVGGAYYTTAALGAGDGLTTPLLPGPKVPLGGLFADPFRRS